MVYTIRLKFLRENINRLEAEVQALNSVSKQSRSPALKGSPDDLLTEKLLSHPVIEPFPRVRLGSRLADENDQRILVAERLLSAYHKSIVDEHSSLLRRKGEDLWSGLIRSELPGLMSIIENKDPEKLANYLMHFGESFVWFGGITTCIDGYNRNLDPQHIALTYLDKLVCIGEYLGLLQFESPEDGPWGINLQSNVDELVDRIEGALNISITPPSWGVATT